MNLYVFSFSKNSSCGFVNLSLEIVLLLCLVYVCNYVWCSLWDFIFWNLFWAKSHLVNLWVKINFIHSASVLTKKMFTDICKMIKFDLCEFFFFFFSLIWIFIKGLRYDRTNPSIEKLHFILFLKGEMVELECHFLKYLE